MGSATNSWPLPDGRTLHLRFQSMVGYFELRVGTRHLVYNPDVGWATADGSPEPWEADLLFAPDALAAALASAADYDDPAARRTEIEAAWATRRVVVGRFDPAIDARALFDQVCRVYGVEP